MLNKKNLQLFIHERLKYKDHVKIEYCDLIRNNLHIVFIGGFDEVVHINMFNE